MVAEAGQKAETKTNSKKAEPPELSEEDRRLKEELGMLMQRLIEDDASLYKPALETMKSIIRSSTTSMTSVPKPLKFMREHYGPMKEIYTKMAECDAKDLCSDIISVLGMTMAKTEDAKHDTLHFYLSGNKSDLGCWGHEYVKHLAYQAKEVWDQNDYSVSPRDFFEDPSDKLPKLARDIMFLVHKIVPYFLDHNAEADAVDLADTLNGATLLEIYCSESNYERVCLYALSLVPYLHLPANLSMIYSCKRLYEKFGDYGQALRCALKANFTEEAVEVFELASKAAAERADGGLDSVQRQLAFLLARQQYAIPYQETLSKDNETAEDLAEMMGNSRLSEYFHRLAVELDIVEPKVPEDIYKSHLNPSKPQSVPVTDCARTNLAASYVNGFVNCGFCHDKLIKDGENNMRWIYKNKEVGMMSTVATLGWIMLWDVDTGLSYIDNYLFCSEDYVKAGGLLACAIVNNGIKNDCDPALALLGDYVDEDTSARKSSPIVNKAAIIGLGIAYAGTMKTEALELLYPVVNNMAADRFEQAAFACLSVGLIAVGTLNEEVCTILIQSFIDRPRAQWLGSPFTRLMVLGLGLTCLNKQDDTEIVLMSTSTLEEPLMSMANLMCEICAFAGTGNVMRIHDLLRILSEKYEEKKFDKKSAMDVDSQEVKNGETAKTTSEQEATNDKEAEKTPEGTPMHADEATSSTTPSADAPISDIVPPVGTADKQGKDDEEEENGEEEVYAKKFNFLAHQGLTVLGVAVIAMGEDVGTEMAFRMFGHLLRFGEPQIKRAVPLALALCYISNPQLKVLDTLSKFSHDDDQETSFNAILAMGLVGAGTNTARLAAMLRQLAVYYQHVSCNLFMVRLAQGLLHLGKGTMTLSPFHSDRFLLSPTALAGLLVVLVSCLDIKRTILFKHDYLLFYLTCAIKPRLLMTFDENKQHLPVTVRVGQAVDVVGQAGKPKTITGFLTHTTPVLLAHGERAELCTDEYLPVTKLPLEGFVILKKNPEYESHQIADK